MPTLSADNKLRDMCLKQEGVIILCDPGKMDKVIRVLPVPPSIKKLQEEQNALFGETRTYVVLDANRGPHIEIWRDLERLMLVGAPRDRAVPRPREVANKEGEGWALSPEEVPLVLLQGYEKEEPVVLAPVDPAKPGEVPLLDAVAANQKATRKDRPEPQLMVCGVPVNGVPCPFAAKGAFGLKSHKRKAHKE